MAQTATSTRAPARAPVTSAANIKVLRFNSESGDEPTYRTYEVQVEPTDRVLDALNAIKWYQDGTLTYRRSCAHGVCGSDAMRINGVNRLACKVLMRDVGAEVVVEPLMGFRVLKDLIVDMEPFFAQYRSVFPYLINDHRPPDRERIQSVEDRESFDDTTKCILCAACTTACPSFWANDEFVGPAAIVNAHRFIFDSRDHGSAQRLDRLNGREGVWRCRTIFNCTEACPRDIRITQAIGEVKKAILYGQMT
jgi:succinate dehydrogenase / fumarate reductase iron-sulfur subunit